MLRYLTIAVVAAVVASLGWGAYWFVGARITESSIEGWLQDRTAEGWVANYEDVTTRGFPNRFDTTITEPELADPVTGLAWRADFIQFLSLSYKQRHQIAIWPEMQVVATPLQTVTIHTSDMRGSLILGDGPKLPLDRMTIQFGETAMLSTLDWRMSLTRGQLALRQSPAQAQTYDAALTLEEITPPEGWTRLAERAGLSVGDVGRADLEATVRFDAPWDLDALEVARPQPQRIEIDRARIEWGELELSVGGALTVDDDGRADGELTVRARNWRGMLDVARDSELLSREVSDLIERGLDLVARLGGQGDRIDVPLTFRNGNVTLGGVIPLGRAPDLVLR